MQITIVNPDDVGVGRKRRIEFSAGVHLHQGGQSQLGCRRQQVRKLPGRQHGHNQQRCAGAGGACLQQLVAVEDEIFAQQGLAQFQRGYSAQMAQRTTEIVFVRQHGDRSRTVAGISLRQKQRVEIGGQQAFARRALLHFGNQPWREAGRVPQSSGEIGHRRGSGCVPLQLRGRQRPPRGCHLFTLAREDFIQNAH